MRVQTDTNNKLPAKVTAKPTRGIGYAATKRLMDLSLSLIAIVLLLPVYVLLYVLIRMDSNGPVLFQQKRVGLHGKLFEIYKFRTMVADAQNVLESNPELYEKYVKNNYKLEPEEDPRITKLGHFLRKTSLDELPQFFNVVRGDMSLVGPRPIVEEELKEYEGRLDEFLSVKPGVTGYWQVSGRSSVSYPERVDVELYYYYHQSLGLDLKILFKTVWVVLRREGAY